MGSAIGQLFGVKKAKVDEQAYWPTEKANDLSARLNALIDGYMMGHGYAKYMAPDRRPYEYLSPEEQAQARANRAKSEDGGDGEEADKVEPSRPVDPRVQKAAQVTDPEVAQQEQQQQSESPTDLIPRYNQASFAAALQAKRLGVDPTTLALTPPKALAQQNQAQQQQAMEDISNFIRRGRRAM